MTATKYCKGPIHKGYARVLAMKFLWSYRPRIFRSQTISLSRCRIIRHDSRRAVFQSNMVQWWASKFERSARRGPEAQQTV